jgi:hypothetical protein
MASFVHCSSSMSGNSISKMTENGIPAVLSMNTAMDQEWTSKGKRLRLKIRIGQAGKIEAGQAGSRSEIIGSLMVVNRQLFPVRLFSRSAETPE